MNSTDMKLIAVSDDVLSKSFKGVFPRDRLPVVVDSYPTSYVVNTDAAREEGEHWIAIYFESPRLSDVFDSYGLTPFGEIYAFASRNADVVHFNTRWLQNPTSHLCGAYCLYFLHFRSRGRPMHVVTGPPLEEYRWDENDAHVRDTVRLLIEG